MADPYRRAALSCPTCRDVPLRAFQARLACDECSGLLIEERDLAAAITDGSGDETTLRFAAVGPTAHGCPRCGDPLGIGTLAITPRLSVEDVLRCARHGVWLTSRALGEVLARTMRFGGGAGRREPEGGMIGGFSRRSGAAGPALAVSRRLRERKRSPRAAPVVESPYGEQVLACPVCDDAELAFVRDRFRCAACGGTFLDHETLAALATAMSLSGERWELPPPTGAPGPRPCPVCDEALTTETLAELTVDRCATHGMWFDATELERALAALATSAERRPWWRRLFGQAPPAR